MKNRLLKGTCNAKRQLMSVLIICLLALGSAGVVSANNEIDAAPHLVNNAIEEQVKQIYAERAKVLTEQKEGYLLEFDKLGKKLESLGVEFLTPQEVHEKMKLTAHKGLGITPYVATPPNAKNIIWSSFRGNWVKNGVTYEVQHLTAEPNGSTSALMDTGGIILRNTNSIGTATQNFVTTVVKTGVSKLSAPVDITLQVYDAVKNFINDANFSKTTEVTDIQVNYTYAWKESIDFMYVKEASKNDDTQVLAFISSSVFGGVNWTIPIFTYKSNGAVKNITFQNGQKSYEYYDTSAHRNGSFAVAAYLDPYAPRNAYVIQADLLGVGNKTIKSIPVKTPSHPGLLM